MEEYMLNRDRMTESKVVLDLEEYNKLRDFYSGINDGKFVYVDSCYNTVYYAKEKEVLQTLKDRISKLHKELNKLNTPNEKSIDDVKKMSVFKFLKWRKEQTQK